MRRFALACCLIAGCLGPASQRDREAMRHAHDAAQHLKRNQHKEASEFYKLALGLRPDDPELLYGLARCADGQGDPKKAQELYLQVLAKDGGHEMARHALISRMKPEDARKSVADWLSKQPDRPGPYVEDGLLLLAEGDIDRARSRFEQALGCDPLHTRALTELGKLYEHLDHPGRAALVYERAIGHDREADEARTRLASMRKKGPIPPPRD